MSTTFETELSQKQEGAQNSVGVSHGGDMDPNPSAIPATSPDMHKKQTGLQVRGGGVDLNQGP